jgi:hypothetical protein
MKNKIDMIIEVFRKKLKEETGPTMSLSAGKIAGTIEANDSPPMNRVRKRYIFGGKGSRKLWLPTLTPPSNGRRN